MPDGMTAHHRGADSCRPLQSRSAFPLHAFAQDRIDPAEVSLTFRFEPGQDIVVNAERDLRFEGTIVLSDHPLRPLRGWQLGYIGMIEAAIPLLVEFPVRLPILTDLVLVAALLIRHRLSCGNDVNDLDCRLAAIDEYYGPQHQVTRHPDSQAAPFVLKAVVRGDDVIGVRERFPSHLERNSMVLA